MAISQLAAQLLKDHALRSSNLFYDVDVLGPMFRDAALDRLDAAYTELVEAGLMEPAGVVISYFGVPKGLHRLTVAGRHQAAAEASAA